MDTRDKETTVKETTVKKTTDMTFSEMAAELDKLRNIRAVACVHREPYREHAKLTAEVVHGLRQNPPRSIAEAARVLGVSRPTLSRALSGATWPNV